MKHYSSPSLHMDREVRKLFKGVTGQPGKGASAQNPCILEAEAERSRVELHPWLPGNSTHGEGHSSSARVEKVSGSATPFPKVGIQLTVAPYSPSAQCCPQLHGFDPCKAGRKGREVYQISWGKTLHGSEDFLLHRSAQNEARCECGTLNHLWLPMWEVPRHGACCAGGLSGRVRLPGFKFHFLNSLGNEKQLFTSVSVSPLSDGGDNIYTYQINRDMPVPMKNNLQKWAINITTEAW